MNAIFLLILVATIGVGVWLAWCIEADHADQTPDDDGLTAITDLERFDKLAATQGRRHG